MKNTNHHCHSVWPTLTGAKHNCISDKQFKLIWMGLLLSVHRSSDSAELSRITRMLSLTPCLGEFYAGKNKHLFLDQKGPLKFLLLQAKSQC